MEIPIQFPGLGLSFDVQREAFHIGSLPIYWYGVLIAAALLLAFFYAVKRADQFKISVDNLTDATLWSIIFGIIGARLYYVLFYIDPDTGVNTYFADPVSMLFLWNGGLAIYGGIIGALLTALIFCKIKKLNPLPFFDIASLGFLIGQAIGRWGNFFNREAYGAATALPWRMVIDDSGNAYHPCFLYESIWCALGFVLLHFYSKRRKFNGEVFLMYAAWYSFGRFFIEGLRTDSLMIGSVRVSQMLSALVFIAAVTLIAVFRIKAGAKKNEQMEYVPMYKDIEKELAGSEPREDVPASAENENGAEESLNPENKPENKPEAGDGTADAEKKEEDENAGENH